MFRVYRKEVLWADGGLAEEEMEGICEEEVCLKLDIMVSKVKNQDWLTQLREKNKNMPVIDISKDYQVVITDFYQISKPGSKEVE